MMVCRKTEEFEGHEEEQSMAIRIPIFFGLFASVTILLLAGTCFLAEAEIYKATVTREDSNLYVVDWSNPKIYIKTNYCYEYAYSERVLIDTDDMEITFLDSDKTCTIDKILSE